jgi:argininosuccinate lyase
MAQGVGRLVETFADQAERNLGIAMAGNTHMQHAQPVLLSHWLLAHAEAFLRDVARCENVIAAADSCPLGSGALAGCAFSIDRTALARELGFESITANSIDAVSDRDFALEYLFALSVLATHLSRLSEDFVLFASSEFGYVSLPDDFSTGSSLMPQKKNPDSWELTRGKSGRISAALFSLLMTMKGLPTSYQRDLQEDKEALFGAHDAALQLVHVAAGALAATKFNRAKLEAGAANPALLATEAADYLVARGVPFREAHEIAGKIVREAENQGKTIINLPLDVLRKYSAAFGPDYFSVVTLEAAISRKQVPGGTSLESVRPALDELHARLGAQGAAR